MRRRKNIAAIIFFIIGIVAAAYIGLILYRAFAVTGNVLFIPEYIDDAMLHPFDGNFGSEVIGWILFCESAYIIAVLMYKTKPKKYMRGREYGSAKYMDPEDANRRFADPNEQNNRILSRNVRMSLNTRKTGLNNNELVIGGSGAGKTFFFVKPNLMALPKSSFVCTDPKGEITRSCAGMLKRNGYNVKVLNLIEPSKSERYNPFSYIRSETDVVKLVTNIISNTTPKGGAPTDPFWEKAEGLFLQSLFLYVWSEMDEKDRNFGSVMKLLSEAEVVEGKDKVSNLTARMEKLAKTPLGNDHPALKQYRKCMRGAGDTVRSIIISANSRLAYLENKEMLSLLSKDDLNLAEIGIGVDGDEKTKTALFCIIPDSDKSYNFIVGMLYTQIFQELYYQADFNYGGRLPIHVTFMLDEFANVALPDDFCSLLSTMRSREISSVIIIQNLAQIKALFKETWETIPGNCDTLVYLGGNEQTTHKYISELLGKGTINKDSSSETKSRNGSSSHNYDVIGRELMTADEARKMQNGYLLLFIRGVDPIYDRKFIPMEHPRFSQTADGGGEKYEHIPVRNLKNAGKIVLLGPKALEYYKKRLNNGDDKVHITKLSYEDLQIIASEEMQKRDIFARIKDGSVVVLEHTEDGSGTEDAETDELLTEVTQDEGLPAAPPKGGTGGVKRGKRPVVSVAIAKRKLKERFSEEQEAMLKKAIEAKLSEEEILEFYHSRNSVMKMEQYIRDHERSADENGSPKKQ